MLLFAAFSLNILPRPGCDLAVREITLESAKKILETFGIESCVGHADAARRLSETLGLHVHFNRISMKMNIHERAIAAIWDGPRLEENAPNLPGKGSFYFVMLEVRQKPPQDEIQDPIVVYVKPESVEPPLLAAPPAQVPKIWPPVPVNQPKGMAAS